MKKSLLFFFVLIFVFVNARAQEVSVSGKVTSTEDGSSLPGVNVLVKGEATGTVTDADGNFKLSIASDAILIFSFVGFETQEIVVGSRSVIDVSLAPDVQQLGEVVIVGYGTSIRQDLTGNIASVGGEDIQGLPVTTVEQAIQGRTAGVLITSQNGKLGQAMNIRVRGSASISATNEPLYVIDGVPITTEDQSATAAATNPLADLNFNDIESIEILKDASAAAIYGSRGANGVVLISTKSGKKGDTKFTANLQYGFSKPTRKRDFINADQYVALYMESALNNDQADGYFTDIDITNYDPNQIENHVDYPGSWVEFMVDYMDYMDGDYVGNASLSDIVRNNTDWQDEAFQDAPFMGFDLSASGGNDKTTYYFSGAYNDQDGILIGNSFQRVSTRLNLNHKINSKVSIGLNYNFARTVNDRVSNDNFFSTPLQLVAQSPITPVRNADGLLDNNLNPGAIYYPATVELENASYATTVHRNWFNTNFQWNILKNLAFRAEYGLDLLTQDEQQHANSKTQSSDVGGYAFSRWVQLFNYTTKGYFNWYPTIGENHDIDVTVGLEFQESTRDQTFSEGTGFPVDQLKTVSSAAEITDGNSTLNEFSFLSYFARINYKFRDKYLLGLSARIDGSSRFGENHRYGTFPAASVGWIISQEGFLDNSNALSFLKIRASYGLTGNAGIGNYESFGTYTAASYNQNSALAPDQIPNPDLTWETTAQFDVGLDFGLFNDAISGGVDYYEKNTSDLLLNVPVPGTSGFATQLQNVGELKNSGLEVVVNYTLRSGNFTWETGVNWASNKNEIVKLAPGQEIIDNGVNVVKIGEAIGTFYLPEFAGANPDNGDALWYLNRDLDVGEIVDGVSLVQLSNGRIATNSYNTAEEVVVGNPNPKSIYGWTNTLRYKGIDLSFFIQGVSGNSVYLSGDTYMAANARYEDNQTTEQLQRWQKPGDVTMIPQARLYSNNGAQASSRYISDGSYFRLKNLTLGYSLPGSVVNKFHFTSFRIYFTGVNLFTQSKYDGWDPEVNTDFRASNINLGQDFYSAPQPKTFTFGIRAEF